MSRSLAPTALLAALLATGAGAAPAADPPFALRIVKFGGPAAAPATREHLARAVGLGFDAVWVYTHQAGAWSAAAAPDGPRLDPAFLDLARWCRERGVRVFVSINPVADSRGAMVFSRRDGERRIARFVRLLRHRAGVRDVVLSFDDQPTALTELDDLLAYGRSAAPAHLDLVRRLARPILRHGTLWLCAAAYADVHLGDGGGPYAAAFLRGLSTLDRRVGVVWTGPDVVSREITAGDLAATRTRLGGRALLLYDNYPTNDDGRRLALGLVLGPLRGRDPALAGQVAAYLACPMAELGASRLPLATVADFLRNPRGYDPDDSWDAAIRRLAGDDAATLAALEIQATEWGGWVGTRNYRPAWVEDAESAARRAREPAYASTFAYTERRYPERMRALERIADRPFRDDLLEVMDRRLAVARALPLVAEYLARRAAGRRDVGAIVDALEAERERLTRERPAALPALDAFLRTALGTGGHSPGSPAE